uniref:Transcription initiation factor IIF subunit alpha n=1 Tax=Steinernema glaseri TaxID=37863 RepID=A0A1I7Z0M0_9BILA
MSKGKVQGEFKVKIPPAGEKRRFSVMKFNGSLNVEVHRWTNSDCKVKMEREDNRAELGILEDSQEFGEGSEYGRAARDEARRKKYGRQRKSYQHDMQPWRLCVSEAGKERKFRSIREGGAGEHADYWVFLKSGDDFLAHKITDWYQFLPCVTHRTLDIDQAEAQFQQRSRVMNQFALKAQIQKTLNTNEEAEDIVKGGGLKIKDDYSSDDEESDNDESKPGDQKKKKKKNARDRKDKKQRVNHADEVAAYESEDGEDEGREYDYMSDSGSDSDRDVKTAEEKIDEAMVGVGDETGLKSQIGSDLESSSDEEDEEANKDQKPEKEEDSIIEEKKKKSKVTSDDKDSSGSDSDDPDKNPRISSVVFMKNEKGTAQPGDVPTSERAKKRAIDDAIETASKRMKMQDDKVKQEVSAAAQAVARQRELAVPDGLNEDTVRKYLRRKPHTTKELLTRIKSKCPPEMSKPEIVTHLAAILKKIEPHQFKQKQGKKEILFFSLANVAK